MVTMREFLQWEAVSKDTIDFKKAYVDMAGGDLIAGLMLSQIVFWHLPDKRGGSKLRVERDGYQWIAKKRTDWYEECRISDQRARRALKLLTELNLIETKVYKFAGVPTTHIRILPEPFLAAWENVVRSLYSDGGQSDREGEPDETNGFDRKDQDLLGERTKSSWLISPSPLTETTTEITTEREGPASPGSPPADSLAKVEALPQASRKKAPAGGEVEKIEKLEKTERVRKTEKLKKKKSVLTKHPAIQAFRSAAHRYPPRAWYKEVVEAIGEREEDVGRWRALVHDWCGRGWNPGNVAGMLEKFRKEKASHVIEGYLGGVCGCDPPSPDEIRPDGRIVRKGYLGGVYGCDPPSPNEIRPDGRVVRKGYLGGVCG